MMKSLTILLHRSTSSADKWSFWAPPLISAISAFRSFTSYFSRAIITPGSTVSFFFISFCTSYTLRANRHVPSDSPISSFSAEIVAIILVRQLPPRLSLKIIVIMLLRKGMCTSSPFAFLFKFMMTIYNMNRLQLIYFDSVMIFQSSTPDLYTRSLPDKSTKCNLLTRLTSEPLCQLSS